MNSETQGFPLCSTWNPSVAFFFSVERAANNLWKALAFLCCTLVWEVFLLNVACWESVAGLVWYICLCTYPQPLTLPNFLWKRVPVNHNPLVKFIISPFIPTALIVHCFSPPNSSVDWLLQLCKKWEFSGSVYSVAQLSSWWAEWGDLSTGFLADVLWK